MSAALREADLGASAIQTLLFEPAIVQQFEAWKATAGGKQVLRIAYAITARYARRFQARGRRVSMKLVWELLRDNIAFIRARMRAKGIMLEKLDGFALNNNFHALVARHILEHRKEWAGLFELRELGAARKNRTVTVIKIENRRPEMRLVAPTVAANRPYHKTDLKPETGKKNMKTIIAVFLVVAAFQVSAMDRWSALAMVEGGSDTRTGPCGEVSRYGIMPSNWKLETGDLKGEMGKGKAETFSPTNQWQALEVAMRIQSRRVAAFARAHGRMPSDGEWALLWHCPARVAWPTAAEADYARRFVNLLYRPEI